MILMQGNFKLR